MKGEILLENQNENIDKQEEFFIPLSAIMIGLETLKYEKPMSNEMLNYFTENDKTSPKADIPKEDKPIDVVNPNADMPNADTPIDVVNSKIDTPKVEPPIDVVNPNADMPNADKPIDIVNPNADILKEEPPIDVVNPKIDMPIDVVNKILDDKDMPI
jgi:hypothetical protein